MPRLPATESVLNLNVTLDAKMLMAALEQQMGPANRSQLWTPGQGQPVVLARKKD